LLYYAPALRKLFLSFLRLGLTAFGGAAMVAHIKEMTVNRYRWLNEETCNDGVALCQSVPGATAMQTAAYVGVRIKGIMGALASFIGFGLPAFIMMLVLSSLYAKHHALPRIVSLFNGLHVVVVAIVANATYSFGKTTFKGGKDFVVAPAASILFGSGTSPFIVVLGAAAAGIALFRNAPVVPGRAHKERKISAFSDNSRCFSCFLSWECSYSIFWMQSSSTWRH
jgi:chromate transporter